MSKMIRKVVLGISGGVDSAVTGLLLKSKGFEVIAVFMKNWDIVNELGECQSEKDFQDAQWVCNKLQIPLIEVSFVKSYWNDVFGDLLKNYQVGKTPNPDIKCNQKIKFDKFFNYARDQLGADAVATGHYARTSNGSFLEHYKPDTNVALLQAKDTFKDQTFFLSQVPQVALRRTMFPLGDYLKTDVRKIAKDANLDLVANKKESMGICFIGRRNFKDFIVEYIEDKPGKIVDMQTGICIGKHNGIHYYTLGQGCRIGGVPIPYYVFQKDIENNIIYAVPGNNHPALFSEFMVTSKIYWIREEPDELRDGRGVFDCDFRFQHCKPLTPCSVYKSSSGKLFIRVSKPQRVLTPGQYAVLYSGDECLGSSEILHVGPSYYFLNKDVEQNLDEHKKIEASQS